MENHRRGAGKFHQLHRPAVNEMKRVYLVLLTLFAASAVTAIAVDSYSVDAYNSNGTSGGSSSASAPGTPPNTPPPAPPPPGQLQPEQIQVAFTVNTSGKQVKNSCSICHQLEVMVDKKAYKSGEKITLLKGYRYEITVRDTPLPPPGYQTVPHAPKNDNQEFTIWPAPLEGETLKVVDEDKYLMMEKSGVLQYIIKNEKLLAKDKPWPKEPENEPMRMKAYLYSIKTLFDSDNTAGFDEAQGDNREKIYNQKDDYEGQIYPGKLIPANLRDVDMNWTPDIAQFTPITGGGFVPLGLLLDKLDDFPDLKFRFIYLGSSPDATLANPKQKLMNKGAAPPVHSSTYTNTYGQTYNAPTDGLLRLWKKNAEAARIPSAVQSGGDYIAPAMFYKKTDLPSASNGKILSFVEGVKATENGLGADKILIDVDFDGDGPIPSATIAKLRYLVYDATIKVAPAGITRDDYTYATVNYGTDSFYGNTTVGNTGSDNPSPAPIFLSSSDKTATFDVSIKPNYPSVLKYLWLYSIKPGDTPSRLALVSKSALGSQVTINTGSDFGYSHLTFGVLSKMQIPIATVATFRRKDLKIAVQSINHVKYGQRTNGPALNSGQLQFLQSKINTKLNRSNIFITLQAAPSGDIIDDQWNGMVDPGDYFGGSALAIRRLFPRPNNVDMIIYLVPSINDYRTQDDDAAGFAFYKGRSVYIDQSGVNLTLNSAGFDAFTHEIGHALELPHPFEQWKKRDAQPDYYPYYKADMPDDGDPANVMNYEPDMIHLRLWQAVSMANSSFQFN